jgi:hypothetical protein
MFDDLQIYFIHYYEPCVWMILTQQVEYLLVEALMMDEVAALTITVSLSS